MSSYLTKEEIKQWRSSTEKCTLEEYAARLGKKLETNKETHDMVDIINNGEDVVNVYHISEEDKRLKVFVKPTAEKPAETTKVEKEEVASTQTTAAQAVTQPVEEPVVKEKEEQPKINLTFNKDLTEREKTVLDYFIKNIGKVVTAKDLAALLGLKRDYVYKYIKNLRTKIVENVLENSEEGGFVFRV